MKLLFEYYYDKICQYKKTNALCDDIAQTGTAYGFLEWMNCKEENLLSTIYFEFSNLLDPRDPNLVIHYLSETISVSDISDPQNQKTLGTLSYSFQYVQEKLESAKTAVKILQTNVDSSSGIFADFLHASVKVKNENETNRRVINIKLQDY